MKTEDYYVEIGFCNNIADTSKIQEIDIDGVKVKCTVENNILTIQKSDYDAAIKAHNEEVKKQKEITHRREILRRWER